MVIDQTTARGRIIAAALRLAAARPWNEVGYLDIADAAGMNLAEFRREFPSKAAIVAAFARMVDDHVLSKPAKREDGQSARDRLFEVVMSRFDALTPYKPAIDSIVKSGLGDPALMRSMLASQAWMLRAAGFPTEGALGAARVAGLASVYASVFRIWLADGDPGMARTMAALDRRLRRAERMWSSAEDMAAAVDRVASLFNPWRETPRAAPTDGVTVPPEPGPSAPAG